MPGLTFADIYGSGATVVDRPDLEEASGGAVHHGSGPTVSWLGILIVLVAWRVLIELAEEV